MEKLANRFSKSWKLKWTDKEGHALVLLLQHFQVRRGRHLLCRVPWKELISISGEPMLKLKLIYDRWSVSQSVLVSGTHLEPMTRFLFSVWQLQVSYCGDGSVIYSYNYFRALPEQSLSSPSPAELGPYFTVSFETPPTWSARSPYLYPPGTRWPSYTPGHLTTAI
jgi:hypothetical protein